MEVVSINRRMSKEGREFWTCLQSVFNVSRTLGMATFSMYPLRHVHVVEMVVPNMTSVLMYIFDAEYTTGWFKTLFHLVVCTLDDRDQPSL